MTRPEFVDEHWIISKRGSKNKVDPFLPYAWLIEKERSHKGIIEETGIIFITNRECPFHCLMCDLWKNTTDEMVPPGAITAQVKSVIGNFSGVKYIKLYNSGSFFDPRAVPRVEYDSIALLLQNFDRIIVESHPSFINESIFKFRDKLKGELEIAIGLETIHPESVALLNKRMEPEKFARSVDFLKRNSISSRAFILLKLPFMSEEEGIAEAKRSIDFAFNAGVDCCTVIPVRPGNGAIDYFMEKGMFTLPVISSLEEVLGYGISLKRGRVFADTWDLQLFSKCDNCFESRLDRILYMNLNQEVRKPVDCSCNT